MRGVVVYDLLKEIVEFADERFHDDRAQANHVIGEEVRLFVDDVKERLKK